MYPTITWNVTMLVRQRLFNYILIENLSLVMVFFFFFIFVGKLYLFSLKCRKCKDLNNKCFSLKHISFKWLINRYGSENKKHLKKKKQFSSKMNDWFFEKQGLLFETENCNGDFSIFFYNSLWWNKPLLFFHNIHSNGDILIL